MTDYNGFTAIAIPYIVSFLHWFKNPMKDTKGYKEN